MGVGGAARPSTLSTVVAADAPGPGAEWAPPFPLLGATLPPAVPALRPGIRPCPSDDPLPGAGPAVAERRGRTTTSTSKISIVSAIAVQASKTISPTT